MQSQQDRVDALREFVPTARGEDWRLEIAGQRVQIIKGDPRKGGKLEFGTEIIRSSDGSLAALLGASPGASTAVSIMLELVANCRPTAGDRANLWGSGAHPACARGARAGRNQRFLAAS